MEEDTHTLSPTSGKQEKAAVSMCHVAGSVLTQVLLVPSHRLEV